MSRRAAAWAALALLSLVAFVGLQAGWFAAGVPLTLHLRCPDEVAGTLAIALLPHAGAVAAERQVDLKASCAAGRVELPRLHHEADLRLRLVRADGQTAELTVRRGTDLQRDRDGAHAIVRIIGSTPFLLNDRL